MARCELTHIGRQPLDLHRAAAQHAAYERALEDLGFSIRRLDPQPELPDSVFVEDAALVLDEVAVIARPGARSRRAETATIAEALAPFRPLARIEPPGTLEGGDVLRLGRRIFVGRSSRTNDEGIAQLHALVGLLGYSVQAVPVTECLHLKSAVTDVAPGTLLVNPRWIPVRVFDDCRLIEVDPREPHAANALLAGGRVLFPEAFTGTAARLRAEGIGVQVLDVSEIAKAEGGLTCCSLLIA